MSVLVLLQENEDGAFHFYKNICYIFIKAVSMSVEQ